eukprot:50502-Pelagomonas_calceolata.AAC.1
MSHPLKAFWGIHAWPYVISQLAIGGQLPHAQCAWNGLCVGAAFVTAGEALQEGKALAQEVYMKGRGGTRGVRT